MLRFFFGPRSAVAFCVACLGILLSSSPSYGLSDASIRVEAPERVKVGHPIGITLSVEGANDVAGYETNLLFDKKAAEFASLLQESKDLGGLGRDVEPLGPVVGSGGVSVGGFSCPVNDCVEFDGGSEAGHGVGGSVELATMSVIPKRPGRLEFGLAGTKLVDAAGEALNVRSGEQRFFVRVVGGSGAKTLRAAPSDGVPLKPKTGARSGRYDLTGDGAVTYTDAMEAAVAWTRARGNDVACGAALESFGGGDVNGDGCLDVADLQSLVASDGYTTNEANGGEAEGGDGLASVAFGSVLGLVDWMAPQPALAQAASAFTVNSTADGSDVNPGNGACATSQGACTLRAAIEEANLHTGPNAINFDIPGTAGVKTITVGSTMPTINDASGPTTIDGYTQPGSSPNSAPLASNAKIGVQITPSSAYAEGIYGLTVTSPGNTIRGLSFYRLRKAVWMYGSKSTNNTLAGTFVGTDASGSFAAGTFIDEGNGVELQNGASNNTIGGASAAARNVLSGNARHGVGTYGETADSNRIINNIMGLSPSGDRRLANVKHGIDINGGSSQNRIGGTLQGERNVISGNGEEGVEISHEASTTENEVVGNFIGTSLTGEGAPAYARNLLQGVQLEDRVTNNLVADNVIGNNGQEGVRGGPLVAGTVVRGNWIGISPGGVRMPNGSSGVQIQGTSSGWRVGPGNTIAFNGTTSIHAGVRVGGGGDVNSDRNTVTRNSTFSNAGLGIDLEPLGGPNQNDAGDADDGANEQLNFPLVRTATAQQVSGTACGGCVVEAFAADSGANAYGEGKTFVGSTTAGNDGAFSIALGGVANGAYVSATATDQVGNTSEFSANSLVSSDTAPPARPGGLTATASSQGGGVSLDWSDNREADLAGYSVYRSTTSGGPYTRVTSSLLTTSAYTDTRLKEGTTYRYVVTATDRSSNESPYGSEASATVPVVALSFNGINDWASVPSSRLLNQAATGARTYEALIKTGPDVSRRQFVYEEGGDGNGFSMEVSGGRVRFSAWSTTNGWRTVSASAAVAPNTLYHVGGVYQQTAGGVRLYLDGALQGTSSGTVGAMPSHGDGTAIGGVSGSTRDHAHTSVATGSRFGGLVAEFAAWDRARTAAQVKEDSQVGFGGTEAGLILLYKADEGSGTVLNDSTANRLHAAISGASWTRN